MTGGAPFASYGNPQRPMPQGGNGMVHLRVTWPGVWMVFAFPLKLYVNNQLIGSYYFKRPFDVQLDVPANSVLNIQCGLIWPRRVAINGMPGESITCALSYSRFLGFIFANLKRSNAPYNRH